MFEGHPNLLPAYFEDDPRAASLSGNLCAKAAYCRGKVGTLRLFSDGQQGNPRLKDHTDKKATLCRPFTRCPKFAGKFASGRLLDCRQVRPLAVCLREDQNWVTTENARFVPHVILD